jgi:hypothetical protein
VCDGFSLVDLATFLGAVAAVIGALVSVIFQLRMMRADIVSAVEKHTIATLAKEGSSDD